MKKSVFFRLTDEEFEKLEAYCKSVGRSKSDVLRELIRSLKIKKKPSSEGRGFRPISPVKS
ncbi:MAG: ribbon-helix-helix protein, CopG family [Microcoleus sp. PH2017_10_PVI_O_A]|nr:MULTISPECIES: ribbon-helix-helix protein, CopG family [unclassified Microcoleus]TAE86676.1 MAG: ribbon-helix-helix protein, CopG family [Oscillatoriales cyanobacterium]MCC3409839.1 ribbon-helix-helix protein, CopG family [Microcoleus sp. PH2017_10_PVI_O_A]MCC3464244.1 ribbon-helix-helix protein, CopG family [Microcoleus sp. PH2017_11_PCY_U_A]MCC3482440.1 ribbon-helix-helix protein, CopG family [Microcoleus sp. PH2017_12_PCY_D_A]MCC3532417.1 ribbon-helix-helix protein, CopG family [Microcole